jgi:hypothetical protein
MADNTLGFVVFALDDIQSLLQLPTRLYN